MTQDEIVDSEAGLEDKIVPEGGAVAEKENSQLSDLEDIFEPREERVEIQAGDIERAENFLDSLGEDLMESDFLEFL